MQDPDVCLCTIKVPAYANYRCLPTPGPGALGPFLFHSGFVPGPHWACLWFLVSPYLVHISRWETLIAVLCVSLASTRRLRVGVSSTIYLSFVY